MIIKRGFTLVELSIVLVIIGLLIGGILTAQSMVSTVKIQSFISQVQQYDVAVSNFQLNYQQFPGDSNLFTPAGNDNGTTATTDTTLGCGMATCYEFYTFWKHLSDSGMIKETYTGDFSGSPAFKSGINTPKTPLSTLLIGGRYYATDALQLNPKGFVYVADGNFIKYLTGRDAVAIDAKTDNGILTTGFVRGYDPASTAACVSSTTRCVVSINMGSSTGQPLDQ